MYIDWDTDSPLLHSFAMSLPDSLRKLCCSALWRLRAWVHADHRHEFSPYTNTKLGLRGVRLCEFLEWRARDFEIWDEYEFGSEDDYTWSG